MNDLSLEDAYAKWADELVGYATVLAGATAAADVVADAFTRLLAAGDGEWTAVREPRGYLFRCVLNSARMHHRGGSRRAVREERSAARPRVDTEHRSGEWLMTDPRIAAAVRSLSLQQRAAIYHTYWEDLPVGEVAALLETSEGSVKRQLARARATLREVLS